MKILPKQYPGIINLILIIIFCSTLVFSNNLNSYCLFAIFFFNLYISWDRELFFSIIKDKYYLLFLSYFILIIINCFLSDTSHQAIKLLERSIAFPFLPIAIGFMVQDHRVYKWFLNSFIWVLTGMVLIALIVAFSKNIFYNLANDIEITTLKSWFFTYHYLAGNVNITAIYFSLYISFAAVILLYNMYIQNILDNKWTNKMRYPIIVILSLGLILLSARTILFTYTLISLIIIGRYFYKRKKIFSFILGSISLFFVFGLLTAFNDVLYLRLKGIFQPLEETKYFSGGLYSRIYQWKAVFLEFCHNNILLGFGTGDSQNSYNKAYIDANLPWAEMDSFNIHNMYLESLFSMGLLGALILISILISSIYFAYVSKNKPYLIFLVIFMFAGLTESLLNRQYGIIFFIFVNFIFYYHLNERYIKNSHPRN